MEGAGEKGDLESAAATAATSDSELLVSSDDEIDYSIKPDFYDPKIDERDELWVNRQRKGHSSDAILSCPACFSTLCLDCQRHEKYLTQYRAMFVVNCKVKTDQVLRQGKQKPRKSKKHAHSKNLQTDVNNNEVLRPVCCAVCSTEVAVFDENEIYHFFNVIPSYS